MFPGNTLDQTTLKSFLEKIENLCGKARRVWVMDRGIPTEATLEEMRREGVAYLVGTPRSLRGKLEEDLVDRPWERVPEGVQMKLLAQENELYVLARSADRHQKEAALRRRGGSQHPNEITSLVGCWFREAVVVYSARDGAARVGLLPFDDNHREIIRLCCPLAEADHRFVKPLDDAPRRVRPAGADHVEDAFGAEQFAVAIGPLEEAVRYQDQNIPWLHPHRRPRFRVELAHDR